MAEELIFFGWWRNAGALPSVSQGGRLRATVNLQVEAMERAESAASAVAFDFYGPADVTGLLPGSIGHGWPAAGATDAEETMCPYVEFGAIDLPWRYVPVPRQGDAWRPWLVLVVGPTDQMLLEPGGRVAISRAVLQKHPLQDSARWAHVQQTNPPPDVPSHTVSRLLSPVDLAANTDYLAAVVPAFKPDGTPSWNGSQDETVAVYHSWRFRTGDAGDFKDLALRLKARAVTDPIVAALGRESLEYPLADRANVITVRSALVPPAVVPPSGIDPDGSAPFDVAASVQAMRLPAYDAKGRRVLQLPQYGDAWVADPLTPAGGWGATLNDHPRHRVAAGLGWWCGVGKQELIADAAAARAGGVFVASQRIRGLTVGLAAAGALWRRRLPSTPEARLALFGPSLARVAAADAPDGAGTIMSAITDPDSGRTNGRPMPPALFSSSARRLFRPRTARARQAADEALAAKSIVRAANECARITPVERPAHAADRGESQRGLPHADLLAIDFGMGDSTATFGVVDRPTLATHLADAGVDPQLLNDIPPDLWPELVREIKRPDGPREDVFDELRRRSGASELSIGSLRELLQQLEAEEPRFVCRPVNVNALDAVLVEAFRPHAGGTAAQRVLSSIDGLDPAEPLSPPEICPDLDLPAWAFLRDEARGWLLLGREAIQPDDVVAVGSNPRFINAFLTGLNTQALAELRWRNVPVKSGCTPLRRFWDRITPPAGGTPSAMGTDIRGIAQWTPSQPLGHPDHSPDPASVRQLVLAFRTDLFRRYPRTLVYLTRAAAGPGGTPDWIADATFTDNVTPVFTGEIDRDLVFFGFPVKPEDLADRWVVVEEAPPGYRFSQAQLAASGAADGGAAASAAFVKPTRVLFRGDRFLGGVA
jgi:hypothetical protein